MKRGGSGLLALGVGIAGLLMLGTEAPSPSSVLDRLRGRKGPVVPQALPGWPLDPGSITRIGESLGAPRVQHTHQGVDLFVPAGSPVVAPADLRIVRVVNGSAQESASAQRAGMWVDGETAQGLILRFLHLQIDPPPPVHAGEPVRQGELLGHVAKTGSSGLFSAPSHLHFEVRPPGSGGAAYGPPVDPLTVLPEVGIARLDERLRAAHAEAA